MSLGSTRTIACGGLVQTVSGVYTQRVDGWMDGCRPRLVKVITAK